MSKERGDIFGPQGEKRGYRLPRLHHRKKKSLVKRTERSDEQRDFFKYMERGDVAPEGKDAAHSHLKRVQPNVRRRSGGVLQPRRRGKRPFDQKEEEKTFAIAERGGAYSAIARPRETPMAAEKKV